MCVNADTDADIAPAYEMCYINKLALPIMKYFEYEVHILEMRCIY